MNSSIKSSCSKGINAIRRYASSCDAAFSGYKRSMEIAKNTAKKYKDEDAYIAEQRGEHAEKARSQIREAEAELAKEMKEAQAALRKAVAEHIAMPPRKEYIDLLRNYRDFGVPITRGELDALIQGAGGNFFAQRALYTTAKAAGWTITAPDADEYAKMLDSFNYFLEPPFNYAGRNFTSEAVEVYALDYNNKVFGATQHRADGTTYRAGSPVDWYYIHAQQNTVENAAKRLEQISENWSKDFVPSITAYKKELEAAGIKGEAAEQVAEVMQSTDAAIAAERVEVKTDATMQTTERIGKQRAKANAEAKAIREAYGAK